MATSKKLAPHETFKLQELLTQKNVCAAKSESMVGLVTDEELKTLLQDDLTVSQGHIQEIESLLQTSEFGATRLGASAGTTGSISH